MRQAARRNHPGPAGGHENAGAWVRVTSKGFEPSGLQATRGSARACHTSWSCSVCTVECCALHSIGIAISFAPPVLQYLSSRQLTSMRFVFTSMRLNEREPVASANFASPVNPGKE